MEEWLETREGPDFLARVRGAGQRAALATVVRVRGSAYRHEGAKLVVAEDGSTAGNVSGGWLGQDVREVALQVIRKGESELRSYCSSADEIAAWDLGVGCEGQLDVYVERAEARPRERALLERREPFAVATIVGMRDARCGMRRVVTVDGAEGDLGSKDLNARVATKARELLGTGDSGIHEIAGQSIFFDVLVPPPQLVVLGAGDDARPLVRFAADVGFRVVVVDRRPGYLTVDRFPAAAALIQSAGDELGVALRAAGVILASGASRRMGQNKMLLQLDGESLVRRAARRALGAGLSPVVVVVGHEADRLRAELKDLPVEFAVNADYTGPTSGSLHQGLNALGSDVAAVVVMLGDMVRVTAQTLAMLIAAARGTDAPLVVSRYGDVTAPPLLFRRALFGELLAWTGEGCGQAVAQAHKHEAMYVDRPEALLVDVDTPEDFEAVSQHYLAADR